jgi:hypothetical protein
MVSPLQQSGLGQVSQGNPEYGTRDVPFTRSGIAEAFRTNPFLNALISGKGLATELREQKQKPLDLMQADAEMIDIDASPISSALGSFNSAIGEGVPGLLIADQIAQADAGMTDIDSGISSDIAQLQQDLGEKKKAQVEDQGIAPDVALDEVSRGEAPEAPQDEQLSPLDKAFEDAMSEYENINAGEETPRKTLAEYKKDFADATGIDVSGKVDKSAALQAFGLALMQNQAGKGFNVSKLLTSLGEAGEKASPKLEKARERARTAQLAAGKYGLEQVAADDATEIAARVAQKKALNELNNTNLDNKSKAIIKQAELDNDMAIARLENKTKLREASIAANEAPDLYTDKTEQQVLFPGADESFQVSAYVADGNTLARARALGGEVPVQLTPASYKAVLSNLKLQEEKVNKRAEEFKKFEENVSKGITVQDQLAASLKSFGRNFGIGLGEEVDPVSQAKFFLERIQTQFAPQILQEAGKTISDADRERVKRVAGQIDLLVADESQVLAKVREIYKLVVDAERANLDTAYGTLDEMGYPSGRPTQDIDEELDEDAVAELAQLRIDQGG